MPVAYSYLRFSSPQQATGDSIRRQVEKTAGWCQRNGVQLDTSMTLRDEGVSAYRGKHRENPDTHALASFVNAVKLGRVQPGAFLVVESLDRLSREKIRPALTLLLNLIEAGVKVVQLIPVETVYDEDVEPMQLMMAVMELNRGHSESKVKSERVGAAWARKRQEAGSKIVTKKLPGWIGYDNEKLVLDPAKAAIVRRVFDLALAGSGVHAIAVALNADRVPVMGRKVFKGRPVKWNETVVYHVLKSRATFGEFQPSRGRGSERVASGEPISDYFPAVISYDTFLRARAALQSRTKHGSGRRGAHINLFAGLLRDARDGGSLTYKHLKARSASIIPVGAKQGRGTKWSSFPAVPFEAAVRSKLAEVKAADIAGVDENSRRAEVLSARRAELVELVGLWQAKMSDPNIVEVVAANLSKFNAELMTVSAELAQVQSDAANPLSEVWGEARTLAGMNPDDDTDELRTRIRAALRRCIESVHCLFTGAGRVRRAAVRVQFRGGTHRDYIVEIKHLNTRKPASAARVITPPHGWTDEPGELDIRKPEDATLVEKLLNDDGAMEALFALVERSAGSK